MFTYSLPDKSYVYLQFTKQISYMLVNHKCLRPCLYPYMTVDHEGYPVIKGLYENMTCWWFQPTPFEKYARQNGFIFPKFRGEHSKKYLSCHHLDDYVPIMCPLSSQACLASPNLSTMLGCFTIGTSEFSY